MFGLIAHYVKHYAFTQLLKESSKYYESARPDDSWTFTTSRAAAISDRDGDFCCWWLTPDARLLVFSRPKSSR
jgi:hypothetical protein